MSVPIVERISGALREAAEERLGVTVVDRGELDQLRESFHHFEQFREDASELAYMALDAYTGRRDTMRPGERNRLAERSRKALRLDPLAGSEAALLANFSFGKGVAIPNAEEEAVQEAIEEAWTDPVNQQKLTGFEAQRHRSYQLITDANLYPTAYVRNGRVRLGFLEAERVVEVLCDEDDDERPLWYVYEEPRKATWNFRENRWNLPGEGGTPVGGTADSGNQVTHDGSGLMSRIVYYPHWRNVEDAERERKENGLPPLERPPADRIGDGLVEHIRINRIGRTQFGTPPWARTLRFFTAMNQVVEAHVAMAQAASQFIAKRVVSGSSEAVTRAANAVLAQTGELGAARFGQGVPPPNLHQPVAPGSFAVENEQHRLESLQLNSGAAQAQQTTTIVRAPISASSGFGQHYLGDASNANLATATSLELPTLMTVQAWQETAAQMFKWFVDMVIQSALRAGRFGGEKKVPEPGAIPLNELHVQEAEERKEAEERTGMQLDYKFAMPYPGRRNLPDVAAMVTGVAQTFDASGQNVPLRRQLLLFLATHGMQVDDPRSWVDEVMPEEAIDAVARAALAAAQQAAADAEAAAAGGELDQREREAQVRQQEYAAAHPQQGDPTVSPKRGEVPKRARGVQEEIEALGAETAGLFETAAIDPLLSENGSR